MFEFSEFSISLRFHQCLLSLSVIDTLLMLTNQHKNQISEVNLTPEIGHRNFKIQKLLIPLHMLFDGRQSIDHIEFRQTLLQKKSNMTLHINQLQYYSING